MHLKIPRLKKAEAAKLRLSQKSFPVEHYTGPKNAKPPALPEVAQSRADSKLLSVSLANAQSKDAAYFSQLHSDQPLEWSGFNARQDRAQVDVHRPKTLCMYGPLIDSPPSHPDTVVTTMDYLKRTLTSLGMLHVHLTVDMQLHIVACLIKWNDPTRWKSVILRPGMMHTLMSFLGTIGYIMKCTGAEELVGAAYSGLASIFSGKAWPKEHVCRHSEGSAAVSSDQFGEQTYIKQGKQAGGMKGISSNPEQVAVWIESFGVCSQLSMALNDM